MDRSGRACYGIQKARAWCKIALVLEPRLMNVYRNPAKLEITRERAPAYTSRGTRSAFPDFLRPCTARHTAFSNIYQAFCFFATEGLLSSAGNVTPSSARMASMVSAMWHISLCGYRGLSLSFAARQRCTCVFKRKVKGRRRRP